MVASGVLERNAGKKAAPKKMARSRSTRRDARTATRRVASEERWKPAGGEKLAYTYQRQKGRGA